MRTYLHKINSKLSAMALMLIVMLAFTTNVSAQIISQYSEAIGGKVSKGIEVWNNTTTTLDFTTNNLLVKQWTNGAGTPTTAATVNTGTLAPGAVMVIGTADMGDTLIAHNLPSVLFVSAPLQFNGDDALAINFQSNNVDVFGNPGVDPGSSWSGNGVSTQNQNIQLFPGVNTGDLDGWTDPSTRFTTVSTNGALTGFGVAPSTSPTLICSPSSLTGFTYSYNAGPSTSKSYTLSGFLLAPAAGDVTINASTNYEISLDNTTFTGTALTVAYSGSTLPNTPVYVRLKAGLNAGIYNGESIWNSGGSTPGAIVPCSGSVTNPATHLAFNNFPANGYINQAVASFSVQALSADDVIDPDYTGAVTLTKVSGPGDLAGTLTANATAGVAWFNDISFTATGNYVLSASATGLTAATSSTIAIVQPPEVTSVIMPQYMMGSTPANNRVPFAYRATFNNLLSNTTYRYINMAVISTDSPTTAGAGVLIFVNADGTFTRSSTGSFGTAGQYGEFTTNASGSYTGWFMLEPSGNARFTPGNEIFMRIRLNDGAGGTATAFTLTTTEPVKILQFSTGATAMDGTAIRGASLASPKNFAFLYDNTTGTGRPLYGTSIETTGIDFTAITSYSAFYRDFVSGKDGSWGGIVPNMNANGVQRIEERSLTDGSVVNTDLSADGVWGSTDTRNPAGGIDNVLVIHLAPELVSETVPAHIQGVAGTNNQRVPYSWHASLSYLQPNAVYRYYNKVVLGTDDITADGAGTVILVNSDGSFARTTNSSMAIAGEYGEFTTDASGNYSGWFMTESTGDSRFTPGNQLFMRLMLNDGTNGTTVSCRITTDAFATVMNFGSAYNDITGTGIRGVSLSAPGNMVFLYDNEEGSGQPLYASSIETTGLDFSSYYADFFSSEVAGINGSWGGIVPNVIPGGVRRIEERSVENDTIVNLWTSPNGVWGLVDTRNPFGGENDELFIDLLPTGDPTLTVVPSTLSGFTYMESNGPSASQSYNLSGMDLEGSGNITVTAPADYEISLDNITFTASLSVPFADGIITNQPVAVTVRLKAGLLMGEYNGETITHNGGGALEKTVTLNGTVTTSALPALTEVTLPLFIEGINGTNVNRIPFAYRATLANLTPDATYRYYNKVVVDTDLPDFNGAGNTIFVNSDGTFHRTTSTSLVTPGEYGEFTTNSTGTYSGWFMTESSGNDRFTPGNQLYMRLILNDGNEGTEVAFRFTTTDYARVLQFGIEALPAHGTAIRAISNDQPGDFVFLYDDQSDTIRPLYGTSIETTGIDFIAPNSYAPFYTTNVAGVNGSWGGIVPNMNANGVQMIQVYANNDGTLKHTYQMPTGIWGTTDTRNPSGGVDAVLYIDLKTINVPSVHPQLAQIMSKDDMITIQPASHENYSFTLVSMVGRQMAACQLNGKQELRINLPTGFYIARFQNNEGVYAVKLFVK